MESVFPNVTVAYEAFKLSESKFCAHSEPKLTPYSLGIIPSCFASSFIIYLFIYFQLFLTLFDEHMERRAMLNNACPPLQLADLFRHACVRP